MNVLYIQFFLNILNGKKHHNHIIGSCTTRDIFRILNKDNLVGKYSSRSSLISRLAPPLDFDFNLIFASSDINWQQKMLIHDFHKDGLYVNDYTNNWLIIDFIDERLPLLKVENTFITQSTEFTKWKLDKILKIKEKIPRGREQDLKLWTDACHKFTKLISKSNRNKTILHKAFWASNYLENGKIKEFKDREKIQFFNKNLAYYYNSFESIYCPRHIIEVPKEKRIADANHKWGLAPFHYVTEYYEECDRQLSKIQLKNNSIFYSDDFQQLLRGLKYQDLLYSFYYLVTYSF